MTSTSSEPVVLRDLPGAPAAAVATTDLRSGTWTRLGAGSVLGDSVTESTLEALAERARAAGTAQGYAAGWAEGRRRAQEEAERAAAERAAVEQEAAARLRADQQALVATLSDAVAQCQAALAERQELLAAEAVELGLRIAEAVVGRELAAMDDAGAEALRRALAEVPPTGSTRPTPRRWTAPSSRTVRSPLSPTRRSLPAVPCSRPRRPRSTPVSRRRSPACGRS